eukprot:4324270-Amphidinium_carterae.2
MFIVTVTVAAFNARCRQEAFINISMKQSIVLLPFPFRFSRLALDLRYNTVLLKWYLAQLASTSVFSRLGH